MIGETNILPWRHDVSSIPECGLDLQREATADERTALAGELGISKCETLTARYTITPRGEGCYLLSGTVSARITQTCIITLDPVTQDFEERLQIELHRTGETQDEGANEHDVLVETDTGWIENGMIDVGRLVFECLSAGIDPYPRREGAEFEWTDPIAASDKAAGGPFAALSKLKDKDS